jgi:hypothetical protein
MPQKRFRAEWPLEQHGVSTLAEFAVAHHESPAGKLVRIKSYVIPKDGQDMTGKRAADFQNDGQIVDAIRNMVAKHVPASVLRNVSITRLA